MALSRCEFPSSSLFKLVMARVAMVSDAAFQVNEIGPETLIVYL